MIFFIHIESTLRCKVNTFFCTLQQNFKLLFSLLLTTIEYSMQLFVEKNSVVRKVWGKSDTILFIFAGAAAEFALNKAVDWLYFTGRLPSDPLGRLFTTVTYARMIVFSPMDEANN